MTIVHLTRNKRLRSLTIGVLAVGLSMGGTTWAGPQGHRPKTAYPQPGKIYRQVPPGHQIVPAGNRQYIYHAGIYYLRGQKGFTVVRPPRGLVVRHLPVGFETLIVAGITTFLFAGVYYHQTPSGYVVVDAPQETLRPHEITPETTGEALAVIVKVLNVRSGPGMNHPVVNQVRRGDRLVVQGTSPGWTYVRLPGGAFGWVMSTYTRKMEPDAKG